MIIHAVTKKIRKIMPLVYLILIVCFVKFLKLLPLPESRIDVAVNHEPVLGVDENEPSPKANEMNLNLWLLVHTNKSNTCYSLAARYHGWNILLIGVKDKTAIHSKCHFLGRDDLDELCLEYGFHNCNTRDIKVLGMIAVLFSLKFKPDAFYTIPSPENAGNLIKPNDMDLNSEKFHLYYRPITQTKGHFFFPDQHFGCNASDKTTHPINSSAYHLCFTKAPLIQAPAIILHTTPYSCDNVAPSVVLTSSQYTMFSMMRALISKDALWAFGLLSPFDYATEEYLFLVLVTQKLLWLTGNRVKLVQHTIGQNAENIKDKIAKIKNMLEFIENWTCKYNLLEECIQDIVNTNFQEHLLQIDIHNINTWIKALLSLDYKFPKQISAERPIKCGSNINVIPVDYSAKNTMSRNANNVKVPINNIEVINNVYKGTCQNANANSINNPWTQHADILLIVVFNNPHYDVIPYVELIYRPFFPNLVYCGPEFPRKHKFPNLFQQNLYLNYSFISYNGTPEGHAKGSFNYECTARAIQMQYTVQGYLTIADDMLLWIHQLQKFPKTTVWFLPQKEIRIGELKTLRECKLGMCDFYPHWNWWEDYQIETLDLLRYMKEEKRNSYLLYHCFNELVRLNGAELRANGAYSDIYYIPQRLSNDYASLTELFLQHKVFLEIAVPTMLRCLEPPENMEPIKGTASWDLTNRDHPWYYFDRKYIVGQTFFHPCKWSFLIEGQFSGLYSDFLCNKLLPFLFDPYGRFENVH